MAEVSLPARPVRIAYLHGSVATARHIIEVDYQIQFTQAASAAISAEIVACFMRSIRL
jgi:hypothetical protein